MELAIVVVVVGILAVIGGVVYTRHRATARSAEAKEITSAIRSAQESYKVEKGIYANISTDTSSYYPAATPSNFATAWGGDCTNCVDGPGGWRTLTVSPAGPVLYGYATIAGTGAAAVAAPVGFSKMTPALATPSGIGGAPVPLKATDPYYVTVAWGDSNGDGVPTVIMSYSTSNALVVQDE